MMLYYLDTNIVIYAVQAGASEHLRAIGLLATLEQAEHEFVISEFSCTETLVLPLQPGNGQLLQDFFRFFHGPNVLMVGFTAAMHIRASAIRGSCYYPTVPSAAPKRYSLPDAIHLAAAIESGCNVFLTNDTRLASFPDITVEIPP